VNPKNGAVDTDGARFRSTLWSVVLTDAQDQTPAGQAALAELYRSYWSGSTKEHLLCKALVAAEGHLAE
jgi:hypothetical protein